MIKSILFMPFPFHIAKPIIKGFYPIVQILLKFFPGLENELEEAESQINAKDYLGGALFTFCVYFLFFIVILGSWATRTNQLDKVSIRFAILAFTSILSFSIFFYILLVPRWIVSRKKAELERNLLFATRHLMIQTNAGVPLFDAMVSISEEYGNSNLDYGEVSKEFKKIIKEVKSGKDLAKAFEESATRNPSQYYRRIIWQLSNAHLSGANMGTVLKDMVGFLSDEQRIMIRNYGSQLNPLSLFYMLTCIIAPTMGVIFLMISSTFVDVPVNEMTFGTIILFLVIMQMMFIGLIKSRRPTVAL